MTSWGGIAAGFLGLAVAGPVLKAAGSSGTGASRLGSLASVPASVVSKFLDPTVPIFSAPAPSTTSSASGSASATLTNQASSAQLAGLQAENAGGSLAVLAGTTPQTQSPQEIPA